MSEFFKNIPKGDFLAALDAQLCLQVDATWPKEAEALELHGLKDAHDILDLGTGNGYFLTCLAKRYPEKQFTGIENNKSFVEIACERIREASLTNAEIHVGKCPMTDMNLKVDFVLARLAMYSMPNRVEVLRWANNCLRKNGRIALIDADLGRAYTRPADPAWEKMINATMKLVEEIDGDPQLGGKLEHILMQAGFSDIRYEQKDWYSSDGMTREQFCSYWIADSSFLHRAGPETFTADDLHRFQMFLERLRSSETGMVIFPMFLASGRKT